MQTRSGCNAIDTRTAIRRPARPLIQHWRDFASTSNGTDLARWKPLREEQEAKNRISYVIGFGARSFYDKACCRQLSWSYAEAFRTVPLGALGFLNMIRRWIRIRRAKREIIRVLSQRVANARVISTPGASLINTDRMSYVIATDTDRQAESLRQDYPNLYLLLREAMMRVGYPEEAVARLTFPIESQETVDREFGGSWQQALGWR